MYVSEKELFRRLTASPLWKRMMEVDGDASQLYWHWHSVVRQR